MSDLKLGEPIPTGIAGIEPGSSTAAQDVAEPAARSFQLVPASTATVYPDMASFDQWLLFPMKLGLSMALASTAMIVGPLLMTKQLHGAGALGADFRSGGQKDVGPSRDFARRP